jgi:N-methylhydantoinase A
LAKQTSLVRAGVDIGGTFTDVALETHGRIHSAKVLTDPVAPDRAILEAFADRGRHGRGSGSRPSA